MGLSMANIVSGAAPEAGQTASSIPTASEQQKPPESAVTTAEKPILLREMRTIPGTPEKQAETITLSEETNDTLVGTVTSQFEIIGRLIKKNEAVNQLHHTFYENFTALYKDKNLSDPETLKKCAREFIDKGGRETRIVLKMMQGESIGYQITTGSMFVRGKEDIEKQYPSEEEEELIITAEGAKTSTRTVTKKPGFVHRLAGHGKREVIKGFHYKIAGKKSINLDSSYALLTDAQRNFFRESGWQNGALDAERLKAVNDRMKALALAQTEIYLKTGVPLEQIDPNFVKEDASKAQGVDYKDTYQAHLIGEGAPGTNVREMLEKDGENTIKEINSEIEEKINETITKPQREKKAAEYLQQIDQEIAKRRKMVISPEQQGIEKDKLEEEKAKLKKDMQVLVDQSKLVREEKRMEEALTEALKRLKDRETGLVKPPEETSTVDLDKWSNPDEAESWKSIEHQHQKIVKQIEAKKAKIQRCIERQKTACPNGISETILTDKDNNKTVYKPSAKAIQEYEGLKGIIEQLEKELSEGNNSLEQQEANLLDKYTRRQRVYDENKDVIEAYRKAQKDYKQKQLDKQANEVVLKQLFNNSLPTDLDAYAAKLRSILDEIDKKDKAIADVGGIKPEEKFDIEALETLRTTLSPENRNTRNTRVSEAKNNTLSKIDIVAGSFWEQYPPALLRSVQIIFGGEIFLPNPPEVLVQRIQNLLRSQKYLDIFIEAIDKDKAVTGLSIPNPQNPQTTIANPNIKDGAYQDLNKVLPASAGIRAAGTVNKIDEKIIDKIVEEMRLKAFGLKPIT